MLCPSRWARHRAQPAADAPAADAPAPLRSVPGLTHLYGANNMATVLQYAQVKGDKVRGTDCTAALARALLQRACVLARPPRSG